MENSVTVKFKCWAFIFSSISNTKREKKKQNYFGYSIRFQISDCSQILFSAWMLFTFCHMLFLASLNNDFSLQAFNKKILHQNKNFNNRKNTFRVLRYYLSSFFWTPKHRKPSIHFSCLCLCVGTFMYIC